MRKPVFIIGGIIIGILILFSVFSRSFSAPDPNSPKEIFTIAPAAEEQTVNRLAEEGFIKSAWAFNLALILKGQTTIKPGSYSISKNMSVWELVDVITAEPNMKWVTIPEGLRKEEIGERLAKALGWNDGELEKWNTVYTTINKDYVEGVYFPDTYLIPVDENGQAIAKRMQSRFDEKFAPYLDQFAEQNILWTTGLRLASVVQREAAGIHDMPLIAGILWNRLLKEQRLEVDATVQYARGKTERGWWTRVTSSDIRNIDSPFNTYKYKGLPPHPISNPGTAAIEAVLNPEETDCLYYLHDNNRHIHCAKTFAEHKKNIEKYLR